jgi:malonate transporter
MTGVLTGFAVIGFVIAVGYVVARFDIVGENARPVFSRTALMVTNPALLFTILAQADLHEVFTGTAGVAAASAVVMAALYVTISRLLFRRDAATTTIGAMSSGYVNANNIGIPVAVYVVGNSTLVAPVLLLQLVILTPVVLIILDAVSGRAASWSRILVRTITNPVTLASLLGVLVAASGLTLPDPVLAPLELLGGAAVPLVLMAFGMSLHGMKPLQAGSDRTAVFVAATLKSFVMPIAAWALARFVFQLGPEAVFGATVMAALPTAQNVFLYASRYDRGVTLARDTVLLSSIGCVPALLVVSALLHP